MSKCKSALVCLVVGVVFLYANVPTVLAQGTKDGQRLSYERYQTRVEQRVYKKTPQGELAIYLHFPKNWAAGDKRPAIVFFFGGAWVTGSVGQFANQAHYLASRGMVTARADYRVRSRHQTTPVECVEDAQSAIRWLRKNAAQLGIDPNRIVASGGSAGGHIAACAYTAAGMNAEQEDGNISARPNLLVLYNPVLDCTGERIARRMGSPELAKQLSPNLHLSKNMPATILFYGTKDRFCTQGREFLKLSRRLGNDVELYVAEGQPHGFFNRAPWHQRTTFLADQFLVKHGYLTGKPTLELPQNDIGLKKISARQREQKKNRESKTRKEGAVKVGQLAPDFQLPPLKMETAEDGQTVGKIGSDLVRLSCFRGKKPVCLIFSSYT